mmetsp:Transcript_27392/g.45951  ORF Transcript_27392/g.45951 Transcript_27392/m.45951 type:complete len:619 (-) Transcript_27392:394-2250(-)|eukprot:CAMPEP_0184373048 /NCGR_PEP_ID=MMETSP1089-20130417/164273_1 /TAXON_ID=38269 ORGANISM="Gloeochaete wittrockiana, Strain SAG46.84" /NCGR_SAMPLE_ID=MMETSP1089 /ASSEMBLY_ACC=CAM_ASM_000445 /LENGTH=618 /DNA_ID=CAMNT_0026715943 /DNA_START=26 /DNA_END=1879 /DNA_ORIENTATION=-
MADLQEQMHYETCTDSSTYKPLVSTVYPESCVSFENGGFQVSSTCCGDGILSSEQEECDDGNTNSMDGCSRSCAIEECGAAVSSVVAESQPKASSDALFRPIATPPESPPVYETIDEKPPIEEPPIIEILEEPEPVIEAPQQPIEESEPEPEAELEQQPVIEEPVLEAPVEEVPVEPPVDEVIVQEEQPLPEEQPVQEETVVIEIEAVIEETCGDGSFQPDLGEECDSGAAYNGPEFDCSSTCKVQYCGDGVIQDHPNFGEECDDGVGNGPDGNCSKTCEIAKCGDGVIQATKGEECDEGAGNGSAVCSAECTVPEVEEAAALSGCGDGVVQAEVGEICDDANIEGGDGCSASCKPEWCGNGIAEGWEECDDADANGSAGSSCTRTCALAVCGNGRIEPFTAEACDEGDQNGLGGCSTQCTVAFCGDGETQANRGEMCDDGNVETGDGCTPQCLAEASSYSLLEVCGNGIIESTEQCDDGNRDDCDGCSNTCSVVVDAAEIGGECVCLLPKSIKALDSSETFSHHIRQQAPTTLPPTTPPPPTEVEDEQLPVSRLDAENIMLALSGELFTEGGDECGSFDGTEHYYDDFEMNADDSYFCGQCGHKDTGDVPPYAEFDW